MNGSFQKVGIRSILAFSFLGSVLEASIATACTIVPPQYLLSHATMVSKATAIVLAESIGHSATPLGSGVVFEFSAREIIKGHEQKSFSLKYDDCPDRDARLRGEGAGQVDHSGPEFWINRRGRVGYAADCKIYPNFETGKRYLLFFGEGATLRSYEEISGPNDIWYLVIKDSTK